MVSKGSLRPPGKAWEQARTELFRTTDVCWLCGGHVDMDLPYRDPVTNKVNPKSKSLDHVVALVKGGSFLDPNNHRLAHVGCNSAKRERPRTVVARPSVRW